MALPGHVAMRLPAAAARLAGVPGSGGPLGAAEVEQVAEMLTTIQASLGEGANSTADALLSDDDLRIAILHLVAFAVRCPSSDPPAYRNVAARAVSICGLLLVKSGALSSAKFARKLLRMDVLKSCACHYSSAATLLATLPGAGEDAAAGEAGAAASSSCVMYMALVYNLLNLASRTNVAVWLAGAQRQLEEWQQLQQEFAGELASALCDSHVLEHAAHLALHMQLAVSAGRLPEGAAVNLLGIVMRSHVAAIRVPQTQGGALAHPLAEVLSGPCLRHAILSLGVAALCAADGGPSHGLPPELLLRLPLLGLRFEPIVRGAPGKQPLHRHVFIGMLELLADSGAAAATGPPRDGRALAALLHRIGRFAVTSARVWAEEGAAVAWAVGRELTQLLLEEAGIMPAALLVLEGLRRQSAAVPAAPAADDAALAEAEAARWRLAAEVATYCTRWAASSHLEKLADSLDFAWRPSNPQWLLAPAAPLAVAAALAGGLLPLWERLLRCAGRNPGCAEGALLSHIMSSPDSHEAFWVLLAYGEPHQGAALVATLGKLLRTFVVPHVLWSSSQGGALDPAGRSRNTLARTLADIAVALLSVAVDRLKVAGLAHPSGSEAPAPQLQLARLVSLAAFEWLPPLARLAREGMPALIGSIIARGPAACSCVAVGTSAVATWLPLLARLCWPGPEAAAGEGGAAAAGSSDAAAAAAASWQRLLLREVGAVEMLGFYCQQHLGMVAESGSVGLSRRLLEGCSLLAIACSVEVRQAVLVSAAAAPGSGGGHGSGSSSGAGGRRRRAGREGEAGPSRAMAPGPPPGWSPQLFRAMEAELRGCPGCEGEALGQIAGVLARQLGQWAAGGVEGAAELVGLQWSVDPAASALRASSPAAARALLRTCSNPACDNLAGDSEAGLQLRACGRCGAAWYCRRECLAFHWRSGHKEACVGRREVVVAVTAGPGQSAA